MSHLPTLYKRTSTGADQEWTVRTEDNVIITRWGQVGGAIQETKDAIATGKNLGKKNETTAEYQALLEAAAQWEKKLKKGYVKDLNAAQAGEVDDLIEGGVFPMLAESFDKQGHKIKFPAFVQPKFDGHRCIGVIEDGKATLWSRTRKPITGLPHIIRDLETIARSRGLSGLIVDGELYNHEYKDRFEELSSFIRTPEPTPGHEAVQYHIYDLPGDAPQHLRLGQIQLLFGGQLFGSLVAVATVRVFDQDAMKAVYDEFLEQGYEGAIVRNAGGRYVNKRSTDLQKLKEFEDAEFEVVAVEEGRGKLVGHAIFVCKVPENTQDKRMAPGARFNAKMKGKTADLKKFFTNPELAVGKPLTVKFQGVTNKSRVPRFPVALRFPEDI